MIHGSTAKCECGWVYVGRDAGDARLAYRYHRKSRHTPQLPAATQFIHRLQWAQGLSTHDRDVLRSMRISPEGLSHEREG